MIHTNYRKSLCRNPLMTKKSIIFIGGYDKGYKIFITDENLFACILIYLLLPESISIKTYVFSELQRNIK